MKTITWKDGKPPIVGELVYSPDFDIWKVVEVNGQEVKMKKVRLS